ncbi:MAG: DUF58 domain-containing protein [Pseudomonadota bacterium]
MATLAARLFPMLSRLLRGRGPETGSIVLDRRRIYILPTRQGLIFALSLLAMLIGSINYGLSLGYALTFMLGGVAAVGILHTYKNLRGLVITDAGALPAFAGEDAVFQFGFEAPGPRFALSLRWREASPALFDLETAQRIGVHVPTSRRGRLMPGRFTLSTVYPLGLFRAWSYVEFGHGVVVYPKPSGTRAEFGARGEAGRAARESTRDGGEDFAGLRAWQPGDSPRQVAWKTVARSEVLATKRFSDVEGGEVLLDWDSLTASGTEARLSQLARMVLDAEAAGLRYGLRLPGVQIAPGNGAPQRQRCLEALALFGLPEHG